MIRELKKIKEGFVGQKMIVLPPDIKKVVVKNLMVNRFYLTAMGYYPQASFHDRERKSGSSQYILLYCTKGMGQIEVGTQTFHLLPNTFFIIPKNTAHHYYSSEKNPWSIYWIHFLGEQADVLYDRYLNGKSPVVQAIPYNEQFIEQFERSFNNLERSYESRQLEIVNIDMLQFISGLVYYKETNAVADEHDVIGNSIRFMNKYINTFFSIDELAKQQGLSVSYYSKLFRNRTGHSPIQYFNQLKIQKSCQYLHFSTLSIKEICTELGFADPYYFSRLFKKLMGFSPSNYKTLHKK